MNLTWCWVQNGAQDLSVTWNRAFRDAPFSFWRTCRRERREESQARHAYGSYNCTASVMPKKLGFYFVVEYPRGLIFSPDNRNNTKRSRVTYIWRAATLIVIVYKRINVIENAALFICSNETIISRPNVVINYSKQCALWLQDDANHKALLAIYSWQRDADNYKCLLVNNAQLRQLVSRLRPMTLALR